MINQMKANTFTHKVLFRSSGGSLLTDHYSGAFLNGIKQSALLTGLLGVVVALLAGCSSTPHNFGARLITPTATNSQHVDARDDGFYQPARSPAFNEDLGG
jgi:hypothetical protein